MNRKTKLFYIFVLSVLLEFLPIEAWIIIFNFE